MIVCLFIIILKVAYTIIFLILLRKIIYWLLIYLAYKIIIKAFLDNYIMEEYNSTNKQIVSNKYTIFIMSLIFVLPALYFGLEKCNFHQSEINEYNLRNPNSLELNTI
jgi:hypothetical protein